MKTKERKKPRRSENNSDALYLPRHADFDAYWDGDESRNIPSHSQLVFWIANRLGKKLKCHAHDLLGTLTLLFNRALHTYEPGKAKFSTYLAWACFRLTERHWNRYETERRFARFRTDRSGQEDTPLVTALTDELHACLPGPEEKEPFADVVLPLEGRHRAVIELCFRDKLTVRQAAVRLGLRKSQASKVRREALVLLREEMVG